MKDALKSYSVRLAWPSRDRCRRSGDAVGTWVARIIEPLRHTVARRAHDGLRHGRRALLGLALCAMTLPAQAQNHPILDVLNARLQQRANGLLAVMGYSQTPDVTSGSLAISDGGTDNPSFSNTSIGGGFTVSDSVPIYLEGTAAYARYDPRFVITHGAETRVLPTRWNSLVGTIGVGWDFHLTDDLVLRPIANGSYGTVKSDLSVASLIVSNRTALDLDFLSGGHLDAAGLGGSLMLDYQHYRENYEVDVELRYTDIYLHSVNNSSAIVRGNARNENAGLWMRWRAPTGLRMLSRPVRYVLEAAQTNYFGADARVLGVSHLTSLGAGLELDTSKYDPLWISRVRLVGRYVFGNHVEGFNVGLAVTFD